MSTRPTKGSQAVRGWVFYDARCPLCVRGMERWSAWFGPRGFVWVPLQTPGTAARLGVSEEALHTEMKLLRADGRVAGGVDAWAVLLRSVGWLWPVGALLAVPGLRQLGGCGYHWLARNRHRWPR